MLNAFQRESIPATDEALRPAVREFLREALPKVSAEQRARSWGGFDAEFSRALAQRGWLGLTLPHAYGGAGQTAFTRFVVVEELLNAGAPVAAHWIADRQSGPLILKYGTEAQRQFYLPKICRGEAFFCIGMSEPNSGSDLASVKTRATKTPTGWRLNGQKIWTTHAHRSHYMIALVRTSGSTESRHEGLSQLIIDLSLPGVTARPIRDLTGDAHFCEVFFQDVDLAEDALIGAEGSGWQQVTAELAFERSGPERLYSSIVLLNEWLAWLRARGCAPDAKSLALAGRVLARHAVLRELSISVTGKLARGESPVVEAALVKDLGTELEQFVPIAIADALASQPDAALPTQLLRTLTYVTQVAPSFSLRGGTREVLRGMIARGLGLR
jgi:alkylation response protein AidB-like acyl-CoA dehydrogenase